MSEQFKLRPWWVGVMVVLVALSAAANLGAQGDDATSSWQNFGNDGGNSKYAPLDEIDRTNFDQLEIAWRWESVSQEMAIRRFTHGLLE